MSFHRVNRLVMMSAFAVAVAGCSVTAPQVNTASTQNAVSVKPMDLQASYAELAKSGGKLFALDPKSSSIRIYAFRGGRAARLGHNHVLSAPQFTGYFHLPDDGVTNAHFDLEFRLDQLEIDNAAYRASLGPAFASAVSPEAIAGTREHMLGADGLQAEQFPFVRIHSLEISGESPKFAAKVQVEMHGQTREMWLPLDVEGLPDRLSVSGAFVMRLTDFGTRPYSVMNGLLAVKDEVVVEFQLQGK